MQGTSAAARFARLRPEVFHVTSTDNVEGIRRRGLRPAAQLAAEAGEELVCVRPERLCTPTATIRDQKPIISKNLVDHLDGVTLDEWLAILNERVFFFPTKHLAVGLAERYNDRSLPQAVLVFATSPLLAAAGDRGRGR